MLLYAILLFVTAALFLALGIALYRGNTKLILDYHQTNIKESERKSYGQAFAKGMFAICATLFSSGMIALLGENGAFLCASLIVLLVGLIASVFILVRVQKKYNGGLF